VENSASTPRPKRQIITPAREVGRDENAGPQGYALHTGQARSMADVTVIDGSAPILERGAADDDEIEDALADAIPASGHAPD
jgi:hypothetical protein